MFYIKLTSLNDFPIEEEAVSRTGPFKQSFDRPITTGQFKQSLDSFYDTDTYSFTHY